MDAGVDERLLDAIAVDQGRSMVGVLLDDREQVTEQPLLGLGEVDDRGRCAIDIGSRWRVNGVDRLAALVDDRRGSGGRAAVPDRLAGRRAAVLVAGTPIRRGGFTPSDRPAQPVCGWFALLRNRLPSSYLSA
jgi:hypothetical protein